MKPNQFVSNGDVELAVYSWGVPAKSRPTVVLVHGYPDAASVWSKIAPLLAEKYYVVAYDVRGAGRSSIPANTRAFGLDHLVEDLAAVVDAVSPDAAIHLLCHDWGSIQSWEAVTTERMKGRIASYTSISGPSIDHAGYWIAQRLRSGSPADLALIAKQLSHSWYIGAFQLPALGPAMWKLGLDKLWPKILESIEGISDAQASPSQTKDGSVGVNLYRANFVKRLLKPSKRHTETPVQLIVPTQDRFMVKEIWDDLPQWVPNLWRREIEAGHWVPISHPQQIADMAVEFIEMIASGRSSVPLSRAKLTGPARKMSGKLVVVTGAGSGIGRETLLDFAEQGASVVAVDIDLAAAERSAELARLFNTDAYVRQFDVGSTQQMEELAQWVRADLGAPDVVVNNAGIGMAGPLLKTSTTDWERLLRVNLWSVILGSKLFAQQMIDSGKRGTIVNVASAAAFSPSREFPAYSTSKAAVLMLSDCLRAELSDHKVNVISICPGFVDTAITSSVQVVGVSEEEQARQRRDAKKMYAKRNLKPSAVAAAIVDAVHSGKHEVLVGSEAHGLRLLSRFAPRLMQRLARLQFANRSGAANASEASTQTKKSQPPKTEPKPVKKREELAS